MLWKLKRNFAFYLKQVQTQNERNNPNFNKSLHLQKVMNYVIGLEK